MENLEFKGTKGDWHVLKKHNINFIQNEDNVLICELDYRNTLGFNNAIPLAIDSNAKLIAASPELLEANQENLIDLKILKDNIESELRVNPEGRWQRMDDQVQKWIERTEKAIEKALS